MLNIFLANAKCNHRNSKTLYFCYLSSSPYEKKVSIGVEQRHSFSSSFYEIFLLQYYFINLHCCSSKQCAEYQKPESFENLTPRLFCIIPLFFSGGRLPLHAQPAGHGGNHLVTSGFRIL